jgi:PucR family transcriptional regulator, purine catabolism regulatory protein
MTDPWHWLEPFDMLMTLGLGMPDDPDDQAGYVTHLADAGISAIAVGEDVGAPPISTAMVAASERRALPVLLTAFEVSFAALARVVADSRTDVEERRRLARTARIYESLRTATVEGRGGAALVDDLGSELGCRLEVLDLRSWRFAFEPRRRAPAAVRDVLRETLVRCAGHLPAILHLELDRRVGLAVPVPARRPAALLASRFTEHQPELSVLQHASTVAALELEKLASSRDALARAGAELFRELLAGRQEAAQARVRLGAAGLGETDLVVGASRHDSARTAGVHQELFASGLPHLVDADREDGIVLALVPDRRHALEALLAALPPGCCLGVSAGVDGQDRVAAAAREARWALGRGRPGGTRIVRYRETNASPWAFTPERAEEVAEHVLGPLRRYDQAHQTELIRTLAALLSNDRSPTRTAADLFIHRQTLVYRMRRIEKLTGRSLSSTKDVVELWLALQALEVAGG